MHSQSLEGTQHTHASHVPSHCSNVKSTICLFRPFPLGDGVPATGRDVQSQETRTPSSRSGGPHDGCRRCTNNLTSPRCSLITTLDTDDQQVKTVYTLLLEATGILGSSQRQSSRGRERHVALRRALRLLTWLPPSFFPLYQVPWEPKPPGYLRQQRWEYWLAEAGQSCWSQPSGTGCWHYSLS